MHRRHAPLAAGAVVAGVALVVACGGGDEAAAPPATDGPDGGVVVPVDGGPVETDAAASDAAADADAVVDRTITITASAKATWAIVSEDAGPWRPLAATGGSVYSFVTRAARWSVAFACDDTDNAASTVHYFDRSSATTALDVTLDDCTSGPTTFHTLTGALKNAPGSTNWIDFADALETRGNILGASDPSEDYEFLEVGDGTWDLLFGLRDDAIGPVTKIAFVRDETLASDTVLDLDFATDGFTPDRTNAVIHGVPADGTFTTAIHYVTKGGTHGLPLEPGVTTPDVPFTFATVPAAKQLATDRYDVDIESARDAKTDIRGLAGSFRTPAAIDATLPAALDAPATTVANPAPHLRLTTAFAARAKVATYEVAYETQLTTRSHRRWRASVEAGSYTMPDFSAVTGYQTSWELAAGMDVDVTASVHEMPAVLGDGTLQAVATRIATFTP